MQRISPEITWTYPRAFSQNHKLDKDSIMQARTRWINPDYYWKLGGKSLLSNLLILTPESFSNHQNDPLLQFSSVGQSCPTLCHPINRSMPGLPVHHQLPEFTQTNVHRVGDSIQPSHPLSSPSPPAPNPSQQQGLFQWVNSSHEVDKVLEFQLQHQSFQRTSRTGLL